MVVTLWFLLSLGCHPRERINAKGEFSRCRDNLTNTRAGKIKSRKVERGLCFPVSGMFHKPRNEVKQLVADTTEHRSRRLEADALSTLMF